MHRRALPLVCLSLAACGDATRPPAGTTDASTPPPADARQVADPDAGAVAPRRGVDVLTQHNDLGRSGANLAETALTTTSVASPAFQKLFVREVDDEIYAQPLIVSGVAVDDHPHARHASRIGNVL